MAEGKSIRILLSGDVNGRLHQLFKRVTAVDKANGPFSYLFCVGQFFPSTALGEDGELEISQYLDGRKAVPLPTYFTGDYGEGSIDTLLPLEFGDGSKSSGVEICPNLTWLPGSGLLSLSGLQVAYLAGKFSPHAYQDASGVPRIGVQSRAQVERLVDQAADHPAVDILLTNEWPQGVVHNADISALPSGINPRAAGSPIAAELAKEIKPRYHVAGSEGGFFARAPYSSPGVTHVTRFIGLATVANEKKQKFIHALSLTPAAQLADADMATKPAGTTASPYETQHPHPGSNPRTWQGNASGAGLDFSNGNDGGETMGSKPAWVARVESEAEGEGGQFWRYSGPPPKRMKRDGEGPGGGDRICFEYASKGSCSRGESCRFRHAAEGALALPRNVCFEFLKKGSCEKGVECRFRHSLDDGAGGGERAGEELPHGVCFDFIRKGSCERGTSCRFRHTLEDSGGAGNARPGGSRPPDPCWFCLASPDVDAHLVVSVGEHCYLALAKGPLVPGHVLILPIEHFPNTITLPLAALLEIGKYKEAVRACLSKQDKLRASTRNKSHTIGEVDSVDEKQGMEALVFERYLQLRAGTHAHLQLVPLPKGSGPRAREEFEAAAQKLGFSFEAAVTGGDDTALVDEVRRISRGGNYFSVEVPGGDVLVHSIGLQEKIPMQLGREVAASILGLPEKGDWKACKLSVEEERRLVDDFKGHFAEFDIM